MTTATTVPTPIAAIVLFYLVGYTFTWLLIAFSTRRVRSHVKWINVHNAASIWPYTLYVFIQQWIAVLKEDDR